MALAKGDPTLTPMGLAARKEALLQKMTGNTPTPYQPFNHQVNVPGQQDLSPPIQMIYTGYASGAGQSGVPAAQASPTNPNLQALANVRGAF